MKNSIKKIMVPLDSSEYCAAATQRACDLALAHGCDLTGLTILDVPGIHSQLPVGEIYVPAAINEIANRLTEAAEADLLVARHQFVEICDTAGVTHIEPKLEGVPSSLILDASKLHDLVVVGQRTFFDYPANFNAGGSLADLLNRTVTPILAVPKQGALRPFVNALLLIGDCFFKAKNQAACVPGLDGVQTAPSLANLSSAGVVAYGCPVQARSA